MTEERSSEAAPPPQSVAVFPDPETEEELLATALKNFRDAGLTPRQIHSLSCALLDRAQAGFGSVQATFHNGKPALLLHNVSEKWS